MKQKPKAIVFLDIDGTLIDSYKGSNLENADKYFTQFQDDGIFFAINSNRSLRDIIPITKHFDLDSIIIAENGAVIHSPGKEPRLFMSNHEREKINRIRRITPNFVKKYFRLKSFDCLWITTDTVKYLNNIDKYKFPEGKIVILNNRYRKYSLSAHIRISRMGHLIPAKEYIQPLVSYISEKLSSYDVHVRGHDVFCNILINSKTTSKTQGVANLKKKFPKVPFLGIGDELDDYEMIHNHGSFYTTRNAKNAVKKVAEYVSKFTFTQGVVNIIQTQLYDTK